MIKNFEEFVCDMNKELPNSVNERKAVRSDKYTVDDIRYLGLNSDGEIDGWINETRSYHPLNVEFYVRDSRINPIGLTYEKWANEVLDDNELMEIRRDGIDIKNPPKEGWYDVCRVTKHKLYIYYEDGILPLYGFDVFRAFEPGGEIYQKSPKQLSEILRVTTIGEYVDD